MALLKIIRLGNPKLRATSKTVRQKERVTKRFQKFLDALATVCLQSKGVGIAAPQVGVNKRIIVVHIDPHNPRYPGKRPFPLTIVINPKVVERSKEKSEDWEGDLSVDIRALVPRAAACIVVGVDRHGKDVTYDLQDDFHARVFQHEIDHLDGKIFIDKVKNKKSISETAQWKKYWKDKKVTDVLS